MNEDPDIVTARFEVYVQWNEGRGGVTQCDSWESAVKEADAMKARGFGKLKSPIFISHVCTKRGDYYRPSQGRVYQGDDAASCRRIQ
jgi:hypothetical protein